MLIQFIFIYLYSLLLNPWVNTNYITASCESVSILYGLGNKPLSIEAFYFNDVKRTKFGINRMSGIYKIKSTTNNKIYIGSSINLRVRKKEHFIPLKTGKHYNKYLQRHVNKYGLNDLKFIIIEFCSKEKLIEREQYYIDTLNPEFNLCPNVNNSLGYKHTEETKRLISKKVKGRKHTEETKNIIAFTSKERWKDLNYKKTVSQKISIKLKGNKNPLGYKHSKEVKQKISERMKGNTHGTFGKGRKHTEETKKKMSLLKTGIPLSKEHKQKISDGHKRRKHDKEC